MQLSSGGATAKKFVSGARIVCFGDDEPFPLAQVLEKCWILFLTLQ